MTAVEFKEKLMKGDKDLVEKLKNVKSPDEAYAVAKEAGLNDTKEAFRAQMKALHDKYTEVTKEDLAAAAGGGSATDVIAAAASVVGAVAAAA